MKCASITPVKRRDNARLRKPPLGAGGARCYLNTYAPLAINRVGRAAALKYAIPPFVDGSIRREPDLEQRYASISCLCRGAMFAPRLKVGDVVAYMTKKNKLGMAEAHRRITAVLKVRHVFENHAAAAEWYRVGGHQLPNNCIVPGNMARPIDESHRIDGYQGGATDAVAHRRWDGRYRLRAKHYRTFVVCDRLFCDLEWTAPIVRDTDLINSFGKPPGTRNPGAISPDRFWRFLLRLGLRF